MRAGTSLAIALAGWLACQAAAAEPPVAEAPIEFSVLTPAMEGRYFIASGVDWTTLIPPYLAMSRIGSGARNDRLRLLVKREGYAPERTIADRLIDALAEASIRAVYEPVPRKPAGSVQSLSWSDLPQRPRGKLMLDLTIRWICLCADVAFTRYYPALSIGWRLLDPAQVVVQPTRTLSYYHHPPPPKKKRKPRGPPRDAPEQPPSEYPVVTVSEACGFDSVKDAEANPAVLWGCLGEAYDAALDRLVIDLQKVYPRRPAGPSVQAGSSS
ncbi:MAG TPA: hypothetical protein VFR29_01960 [Steroidobacteraceae bacterium]|nr:hypothetical protein [Steroidobacteraceae bacterium]